MPASSASGHGRAIDPQLVEYLVIVVPDAAPLEVLVDAIETTVEQGRMIVLDAAVVAGHGSGEIAVSELPGRAHLQWLADTRLGILSENDLALIAAEIAPGSLGVVIVVESVWAQPIADAARAVGGHVAGGERIPSAHLLTVLPNLTSRLRPEQ